MHRILSNHGYTNVTEVESRADPLALPRCSNVTEGKFYYAGADRVAARLGSGGLSHDTSCISRNDEIVHRTDNLFWHIRERINKYEYPKPEKLDIVRIDRKILEDANRFDREKIPRHLHVDIKIEPRRIHEVLEKFSWPNHPSSPSYPVEEPEVYFYHSDHLGGASWITDGDGKPIQHLQYLPFGAPFVNQHIAGYQERFTFTGKERDEETGYGYFGARYMDHELMTMWLSVDPMADKYPSISPYAYCAWSPVKLVDPDGREIHLRFFGENTCKELNKIINEGLGGQFRAAYSKNKDGSYTLSLQATEGGGNKDKLTERQKAFYEMLSSCIEDKETIAEIIVVYGSSEVCVGNYRTNTIDVADMLQFDDLGKGPCTKQGKLTHEFVEQYEKASYGRGKGEDANRKECHQFAISAENYVNGASREDFPVGPGRYHQAYTDNKTGKTTDYYFSTKDAVLNVKKVRR